MTSAARQPATDSTRPPVGFLEPSHERDARALTALRQHRRSDAVRHLEAPEADAERDPAWHALLKGELAVQRRDIDAALADLEKAVLLSEASSDGPRLGAMAWEHIGTICRRREELDRAAAAHENAFRLRQRHGSPIEQWESAHSRAVTAALAKRTDDAVAWYEVAITAANGLTNRADDAPGGNGDRCRAQTYSSLADVLSTAGRGSQAVDAARETLVCWRRCHLGSVEATLAEVRLGSTLVKHAESVLDAAPDAAGRILDEATAVLSAAKESLLAFGPEVHADTLWCGDLLDFANRLRSAI